MGKGEKRGDEGILRPGSASGRTPLLLRQHHRRNRTARNRDRLLFRPFPLAHAFQIMRIRGFVDSDMPVFRRTLEHKFLFKNVLVDSRGATGSAWLRAVTATA